MLTQDLLSKFRKTAAETGSPAEALVRMLEEVLPPILPGMRAELSYEDAIGYFVASRPQGVEPAKGVILRSARSGGSVIFQAFLTTGNAIVTGADGRPAGRRLYCKKIDGELAEAFGGGDMIVVE
jgi:hypothetical protein